jgi:hypothetical protein
LSKTSSLGVAIRLGWTSEIDQEYPFEAYELTALMKEFMVNTWANMPWL